MKDPYIKLLEQAKKDLLAKKAISDEDFKKRLVVYGFDEKHSVLYPAIYLPH